MLESGVDRIITQVVDPKLNHIFRPHIENAIHDFLAAENKKRVHQIQPLMLNNRKQLATLQLKHNEVQ